MAYWFYCKRCGKWSCSASPFSMLSNTNCAHCAAPLTKDDQYGPSSNKPQLKGRDVNNDDEE